MTTTDTLPDDWWTSEQVASHLGVSSSTIRAYLEQMPPPDRKMGPLSLWRPDQVAVIELGR